MLTGMESCNSLKLDPVILTLKRVAEKMYGGGKGRNLGKQAEESSGTKEPRWKVIKYAREGEPQGISSSLDIR